MKRDEKGNKKINKNLIFIVTILIITVLILITYMIFTERLKEVSIASSEVKNNYQLTKNIEVIDIEKILEENTSKVKKEEISVEKKDLEYTTKYINNPELPNGIIQVLQEGIVGEQEIVTKKTYEDNKLIKEEKLKPEVTKGSVNKIVEIGTAPYRSNYNVQIGDTLYVTSSLLPIRVNASDKADKIISIEKDTQVKLLEKNESWYKIQYSSYKGWAKAECLTYINPESENSADSDVTYSKAELLSKLNFDMPLNEPSGLSLSQFKKVLSNNEDDINGIFENNAEYFYYAEKQYNVNGIFLAAVAIHESGWAGSSISQDKNNLFGYGAYDSSPYDSAYSFSAYSEGIDLLARVFVKYYLNPEGTKIYDGTVADGCYYNGNTLSGVNVRYATDKNWANAVYSWMKYLYNRL